MPVRMLKLKRMLMQPKQKANKQEPKKRISEDMRTFFIAIRSAYCETVSKTAYCNEVTRI